MRKVYGLLSVQLSITTLIGGVFLFTPGVKEFVQVREKRSTIKTGTYFDLTGATSIPLPGILLIYWSSDRSSHQEERNSHQLDPSGCLHCGGGLHRGSPGHFLRPECRHPGLLPHGCRCHRSHGLHLPGTTSLHISTYMILHLSTLLRPSETSPTWVPLCPPG